MGTSQLQRTLAFVPFVLAFICLFFVGWAAWRLGHTPYDGAEWSLNTGEVAWVDPTGSAAGLLEPGDQIVTVDRIPIQQVLLYGSKQVGDQVELLVRHKAADRQVSVRLVPPPSSVIYLRLAPLLISLAFWAVSVVVLSFKPTGQQSWLFLLFCQAFSVALASGALSDFGPTWILKLFHVLLWWIGPLAIHFHLYFPERAAGSRVPRMILVFYLLAALGSLPSLVWDPFWLSTISITSAARLLWLAACLICTLVLLIRAYRRPLQPDIRRQVGLVVLGGCAALIPFFSLLLLPYALLGRSIVPDEFAFLLLLTIPFTYGYAILSYRLMPLDRYVSRAAAYTLVVAILAGLYLIINTILLRLIPVALWQQQIFNLVIVLVLGLITSRLYRYLQAGVNYLFYGGFYDYRSAIKLISETLDYTADQRDTMAQMLCESIQKVIQLECVRLLFPDSTGRLVTTGLACSSCPHEQPEVYIDVASPLYQFFQSQTDPIDGAELVRMVANSNLNAVDRQILNHEHARLWVTLRTPAYHLGLCVLGPKRGSERLGRTDLDILQIITRLANIAFQNIQLVAELRERATEIEQMNQQITAAREEERKRVARELHDQTIQALVGLNYHLSSLGSDSNPQLSAQVAELQAHVRQTLDGVRRICADLRPPALDSLGLIAAVRSRLRDFESQNAIQVELDVDGDARRPLPEDIALCLYRCIQEALVNVQKHAQAHKVKVRLSIQPREICLLVQDDGKGFAVPRRLGRLMEERHFGLVGLRERLELVKGVLTITSAIGQGTSILTRIPLPQDETPKGDVL